jgi:hypothetical protein
LDNAETPRRPDQFTPCDAVCHFVTLRNEVTKQVKLMFFFIDCDQAVDEWLGPYDDAKDGLFSSKI